MKAPRPRPEAQSGLDVTSQELAARAGRALSRPGLSRRAVFGNASPRSHVYAYSVLSSDPTKLVRESVDGKITVGRVVGGKFRALRRK